MINIYIAIFSFSLVHADPCVACKNPECICDFLPSEQKNPESICDFLPSETCGACKNPECICDAYELMLQNREKYAEAIKLLGMAIKLIKSAKSHDKKLVKKLKSFYKRSCADLKRPLPEFIQYTGGD
jgi:hypothetical protein